MNRPATAGVPGGWFISPRLMTAYRIVGVGTLHLHAQTRDDEGRIQYRYVIEDAASLELEDGDDLRSAVGADPDYQATMRTLLAFLEHAAETEDRGEANHGEGGDGDRLFSWPVIEWARQHSDELAGARLDLDEAVEVAHTRQIYLDLSTRHLPQAEMERLRDWAKECPVRVIPHEYGAWVNVPPSEHDTAGHPSAGRGEGAVQDADPLADVEQRWEDFPHLRAVLLSARQTGAWWINLDAGSDGLIPQLPVFLW